MGGLGGSMRGHYVQRFGEKAWNEHLRAIKLLWQGIARRLDALDLPFSRVKVYQDGLPVCGREKAIVEDLAAQGSPNHELLLSLLRRGATLVGTEDLTLLLREYHHLQRIAHAKTPEERKQFVSEFEREEKQILRDRDEKIRDQIVRTLKAGETGILFLGLLHRADELMPSTIEVRYLVHQLPFERSFELTLAD